MRARNIKPGFYRDEDLADLPLLARFLFPGLWLLADCEGRLEDRPKRIKAELLPYDDDVSIGTVHDCLQKLADGGFIRRYEAEQSRYIEVINFKKHQNPHKKEREAGSQIPPFDPAQIIPEPVPEIPVPVPVQIGTDRADSGFLDSLIPDSLILIPDPLIPDSKTLSPTSVGILDSGMSGMPVPWAEGPQAQFLKSIGWKGVKKITPAQLEKIQAIKQRDLTPNDEPDSLFTVYLKLDWFDEFWTVYWRKVDKSAARVAYCTAVTDYTISDRIIEAVNEQTSGMMAREEEKRPHAATWLNHRRWEDSVKQPMLEETFG